MNNKKALSFAGGIALIVAGFFAIFAGIIIALFAGADWLLMSLLGSISVLVGGVVISRQARSLVRSMKATEKIHVRSKIKN